METGCAILDKMVTMIKKKSFMINNRKHPKPLVTITMDLPHNNFKNSVMKTIDLAVINKGKRMVAMIKAQPGPDPTRVEASYAMVTRLEGLTR